jgi:hypothetical protein
LLNDVLEWLETIGHTLDMADSNSGLFANFMIIPPIRNMGLLNTAPCRANTALPAR